MLVYIRESDWVSVMAPTTIQEVELEPVLLKQIQADSAAKEVECRERMEEHRYITFKVVTDAVLREQVCHLTVSSAAKLHIQV